MLALAAALTLASCTGSGQATSTNADSASTKTSTAAAAGGSQSAGSGTSASPDQAPADPATNGADLADDPSNVPDAAALEQAGKGLPTDPAEAASDLVNRMFEADPAEATAATGELLRRAGIPIGSGAGPMVAMPDSLTITDAQIGVELLPSLTQQARDGIEFDLVQVQALLAHLGVPKNALTDAQMIGMLAQWGKGADDPDESRYAGAAERALAARHGQLLAAADVPDEATLAALRDKPESLPLDEYVRLINSPNRVALDPVQVLLLSAHLAGHVTDAPVVVQRPRVNVGPGSTSTGGSIDVTESAPHPFRREARGPCSAVQEQLDTEPGRLDKGFAKKALQEALGDAVTERFGKAAATKLSTGFTGYDQLTDVLSYLAFTLSLRVTVSPVDKSTIHFLHDESAHANDVSFRAHAFFKAIVPPEYVDCFALAGVSIPTDKDLKDMKVIWSLPNGRVGLKPAVVGKRQFDLPIDLDKDGESIVQTTPRRESHPPASGEKRPQSTVIQQVRASLDKSFLEAHISDLILLLFGTPTEAAMSIAFKVVLALLQEAGLPERTADFPVTYHGSDVYRIFGDGNLTIPFFAEVPLKADLYSCRGLEGPWQGTITIGASAGAALQALGDITGIDASGSGQEVAKGRFTLNTNTAQVQTFPFNDKYGLVVELDQSAIDSGFQKESGTNSASERLQRVGWASWTIGDQDVRAVAGVLGGLLSQSLDVPVEAVPGDLRCSGTAVYQNEFD